MVTCTVLQQVVGLVSRQTLAGNRNEVHPFSIRLAERVHRSFGRCTIDAGSPGLHNRSHVRPGDGLTEHRQVGRHPGTDHVEDANGEQRHARALIVEHKVYAIPQHRDATRDVVDSRIVNVGEQAIRRDGVDNLVGVVIPRRIRRVCNVVIRFVVHQLEGFLAELNASGIRILRASSHGETRVHVQSGRFASSEKRQPYPVDGKVVDVAYVVYSRHATVGVRVTGLTPLQQHDITA